MGITSNVLKDITNYSVALDVVSLDPTNSSGSTGSMSVSGTAGDSSTSDVGFADFPLLRNKPLEVEDPLYGIASGRVTDTSTNDFSVTISGDTIINRFNVDLTIPPFKGKGWAFFGFVQDLFGIDVLDYTTEVSDITVSAPGFKGNGWVYLKDFMQKYRIDLLLGSSGPAGQHFLFVPARYEYNDPYNPELSGFTRTVNDQQISRQVAVKYFNHKPVVKGEVYPIADNDDAQIFQVNAGETLVTEIQLDSWMDTINQPKVIDYVPADDIHDGTNGVYCVAGSDGLGIMASQWTAQGGRLTVRVTEDPSVVELTVVAPETERLGSVDGKEDRFSPYAIAATSGNLYNSLHLTGTGTKFHEKTLTLDTGATNAVVGEDIGHTVDNPFVSTLGEAYDIGLRAAQSYAGPHYTIGLSSPAVQGSFFGDSLGKRVLGEDVNFRIESVSHSPQSVDVSGTMDTTIEDFNAKWVGKKFADYNTQWVDKTFGENAVIPLRKED